MGVVYQGLRGLSDLSAFISLLQRRRRISDDDDNANDDADDDKIIIIIPRYLSPSSLKLWLPKYDYLFIYSFIYLFIY